MEGLLIIKVWEGLKEPNKGGTEPQAQQQWEPWPLLGLKGQVQGVVSGAKRELEL